MHQRIESLGGVLLHLSAQGPAELLSPAGWLEPALLALPAFRQVLQRRWPDLLGAAPGQGVEVWPGVWLAPLPAQRRRRSGEVQTQTLPAVLLLTRAFVRSEEYHLVCSAGGLDARATAQQAAGRLLSGPAEVQRLATLLAWLQQDGIEAQRRTGELQTLSQQLGESYEELSLLYKLSTSMTLERPPAQFLTEACLDLQQVMGLRWMALQLVDDEPTLDELAGQLFLAGQTGCDAHLLKRIGTLLMQRQTAGQPPLVVDDTQTLHISYLPRLTRQLLVVSLVREDKPLGILFGGDKVDGSHISSVDSKLCNSLAASLSMFLENIMLFEDMSAMFMGTLHALTASIDAKDRYTHGHSERVAMLARQLAQAAGVEAHQVERVYIAGLVHDIGKIGVPEAVLCKPGRLTKEEFAIIQTHPAVGAGILQDIRPMQDLIPGVLYHHERWDGKGYPHGLKGQDIPLYGRIICIADSFDAMSSTRTYRQALSLDRVLGEIQRCAAQQFDPNLVATFLTLDFKPFMEMVRQNQTQHPVGAALGGGVCPPAGGPAAKAGEPMPRSDA